MQLWPEGFSGTNLDSFRIGHAIPEELPPRSRAGKLIGAAPSRLGGSWRQRSAERPWDIRGEQGQTLPESMPRDDHRHAPHVASKQPGGEANGERPYPDPRRDSRRGRRQNRPCQSMHPKTLPSRQRPLRTRPGNPLEWRCWTDYANARAGYAFPAAPRSPALANVPGRGALRGAHARGAFRLIGGCGQAGNG